MSPDRVRPISDSTEQSTTVGRYRLAYELAAGGMATVYLARSEGAAGFEKVVALKRIHPHLAREQDFIEMFLDEARIASRINHPNVCSVFDFGEVDGTYYIAMEYVLGETLARILKRLSKDRKELLAPATLGYACRIVADACDGLHAAHELRGDGGKLLDVVHRDVSPQNLFVAYDGTVRVVDFGIARAAGRLHETRTGAVKGKLAYMAPEQSKKLPIDRRADVWALGCVLWELVCGERLFKRDNDVETIMAVVADDIPKPSSKRPGVPEELERIIMRALERDRDERYPSARELGRDLHRFLGKQDEPVTTGDVADWMARLFPSERQQRLTLVDNVRTARAFAKVERIADSLQDEFSGSEVRPTAATPAKAKPGSEGEPASDTTLGNLTMELSEADFAAADDYAASIGAGSAVPEASTKILGQGSSTLPERVPGEWSDSSDKPSTTPVISADRRRPLAWIVGAVAVFGLALVITLAVVGGEEPEPSSGARNEEPAVATAPLGERPATGMGEGPSEAVNENATESESETSAETSSAITSEVGEASGEDATETQGATGTSMARRVRHVRATTPSAPGYVDIATPGGWADVYLRGRSLGRAPGRVTLPAGRQSLEVRPFGRAGDARRVLVTVQSGASQRLVVNLR